VPRYGPLTDIALADDMAYELPDQDTLPPIRVRCLKGQAEKPFEFFAPGPSWAASTRREGWPVVPFPPAFGAAGYYTPAFHNAVTHSWPAPIEWSAFSLCAKGVLALRSGWPAKRLRMAEPAWATIQQASGRSNAQ
jgi:hypothetical protein